MPVEKREVEVQRRVSKGREEVMREGRNGLRLRVRLEMRKDHAGLQRPCASVSLCDTVGMWGKEERKENGRGRAEKQEGRGDK